MATRPTIFPEWANNLVNEGSPSVPNKQEPTQQWKDSGQLQDEPTPRQYVNFTLDNIHSWIQYLDEQTTAFINSQTNLGKMTVITAASPTLTRDLSNTYIIMTGSSLTLENVVNVGGGSEQIGSTIKVRTSNATTVNTNAGANLVGFTGAIPADRTATFTIEDVTPTVTQWSCAISAGA